MKKIALILCVTFACSGCIGQGPFIVATIYKFRDVGNQGLPPKAHPKISGANCGGKALCTSGPIRVMTYNVLCSFCPKPERDGWFERLPHLRDQIALYQPDLLGLQEPTSVLSLAALLDGSPVDYGMIFLSAGILTYPDSTIVYRKDKFEVLDKGQFWLGTLPVTFARKGWKISMPRYVTWAKLRTIDTGFEFLYLNSHFDANTTNREQAAHVVTDWLAPVAKEMPILFTGDMNSEWGSEAYRTMQGENGAPMKFDNTFDLAKQKRVLKNGVETDITWDKKYLQGNGLIDHILLAGPAKMDVGEWTEDRSVFGDNNYPPSDHFPVIADISLTAQSDKILDDRAYISQDAQVPTPKSAP